MKIMTTFITLCILSLFSTGVFAQTLEDRLKALEETLEKQGKIIQEQRVLQETLKKQEQTIDEQRKMIEDLKAEVKQMQPSSQPEGVAAEQTAPSGEMRQQVQELKEKVEQVAEAQTRTSPGIFNPAIGLVGETVFGYRSKGSDTDRERLPRRF